MTLRQDKVAELIRTTSAQFFADQIAPGTLLTVTRASVSKDLRRGTILVSVFPKNHEAATLEKARRLLGGLRDYLKSRFESRRVPYLDIELDAGEKNRQLIDDISQST